MKRKEEKEKVFVMEKSELRRQRKEIKKSKEINMSKREREEVMINIKEEILKFLANEQSVNLY